MPCEGKAERLPGRAVGLRVEGIALRHRNGQTLGVHRRLRVADFALQDGVGETPKYENNMLI